jgi:hypothetical protein
MLRQVFFSLKSRERVLLSALFFACFLIAAVFVIRGLRGEVPAYLQARRTLDQQSRLLEAEPAVRARLNEALATVDGSRTYSATQLVAKLDSLRRQIGLTVDLSSATAEEAGIYTAYNVRLRVDNGNLEDLVRFNNAVLRENPYIVITQFQFSASRRDPRQIDATFDIASFELKKPSVP